ncbi:helix-turn-helix transcriptional regulator [Kitasatospora sp. NBC_00240]|uniref:LuxR C-terminal-related transcriptional regulator n=1 Tax=Kitasatospora sp. NBC_00240 TaxID=2903567 RepID=UPI002258D71C|nr:helix-turn-helix transcriptional regulator [Kitasatospora sp. NBC_00240]MCX5209711.1 helix-turn-helix transcriptional regulator [Kitasatospora sp. NBC_00240]
MPRLTPKQTEVLALVARGYDTKRIAGELAITPTTVRGHLRDTFVCLGADNGAHAVAIAIGRKELPSDVAMGDSHVR